MSHSADALTRQETGEIFQKPGSVETLKFAIDGKRTIGEDRVAGFFRWLRQRREQGAGVLPAPVSHPKPQKPQWQVVESVASPAIGSIYVQVLQQAGIPVLTRDWGAGAGAMGGVSTGVRVMVPEDRLEEARAVLDAGMADSEAKDE